MSLWIDEYDPLWFEVRRFLSIRFSKSPKAFKRRDTVIFLSDATGVDIPWIWSRDSIEPLFPFDERVGGLVLSEDGKVAFLWDIGGNERWVLDIYYMRDGVIKHVHGDGKRIVTSLGAWDSSGRRLYFTSTQRNGVDFDLYVYEEGFGVKSIVNLEGMNNVAACIGDRGVLVVHSNTNLDSDIFFIGAYDGRVLNLTKHEDEARNMNPVPIDDKRFLFITNHGQEFLGIALYDLERKSWRYLYRANHDVEDLDISPDGNYVVFVVNEDGYSRVYVSDIEFRNIKLLDSSEGVVSSVSWGSAGIFYSVTGPRVGHEVYAIIGESAPKQVTRSPKFSVRVGEHMSLEATRYESWDGMKIPVLIYRPRQSKPPYPAVISLHGGPESQARPRFDPIIQALVRLGFLVLEPNYRGSTGYGKTFVHLDDRERRLDSLRDIGALVEWAEREGLLVKGHVAVTGASYEGYATLMSMALFPDYWSCGVERVGIVNLVTFIKNTGPWRRKYRIHEYGDPDTMGGIMLKLSPIYHVEKIKAPLMIIHGENDPRVPISEAEQLVEAMRKLGRNVEFIRISDEGHGVARVRNRVSIYTKMIEFIVKHTRPPQ